MTKKIFPSTGFEPGSPAWKTSNITITPLETVESYLKYKIHHRLAMSTNSDYMEARHCRNALVYKGVHPVNHFIPEKCVTRPSIFNWLWRSSHQKSAKERNFPLSCLCKIYIIAHVAILAFCSYVIMIRKRLFMDDIIVQKPILARFECFLFFFSFFFLFCFCFFQ